MSINVRVWSHQDPSVSPHWTSVEANKQSNITKTGIGTFCARKQKQKTKTRQTKQKKTKKKKKKVEHFDLVAHPSKDYTVVH